jgi:hypothetical protein
METGSTAGVAAESSFSYKDGTDFNVPADRASSTTRASRAPRADSVGDEDADDEELLLNDAVIATALEG